MSAAATASKPRTPALLTINPPKSRIPNTSHGLHGIHGSILLRNTRSTRIKIGGEGTKEAAALGLFAVPRSAPPPVARPRPARPQQPRTRPSISVRLRVL